MITLELDLEEAKMIRDAMIRYVIGTTLAAAVKLYEDKEAERVYRVGQRIVEKFRRQMEE